MARTPTGWHPEDIKAELRKRYGPITKLSVSWDAGRNAVTETIRRHDYSQRIEKKIAEALDVDPHVIWPRRWAPDGTPLPRTNSFDAIPMPTRPNSQNAKAA